MKDVNVILRHTDHTLLSQGATWEEIRTLCDEGMAYHTASVCIPPCYVKKAKEYVKDKLPICTVIGFPNGYAASAVKVFETETAVADGADEIDMVLSVGALKAEDDGAVLDEIKAVRAACQGKILKVIIETCLLTEEEKIRACRIVSASGADYIKTSTGFGGGGATKEDVVLLRRYTDGSVKVKAAGGISSFEDADCFLSLGADRLGTSRLVRRLKEKENGK